GAGQRTDRAASRPASPGQSDSLLSTGQSCGYRADAGSVARVWSEAEVDKCVLADKVADEPRHLAIADVEQERSLRRQLPEIHSARLAASAVLDERKHVLVI